VLIGLATGWVPAWRSAAGGMITDLKEGGGSASGGIERHRLRNSLVTGQVAIATALCIVAGLLVRSYLNKKDFDPGFDVGPLIEVGISPRDNAYKEPQKRSLYCEQVLERLRSLPGVEAAGVSSSSCIDHNPFATSFRMEGDGDQWRPECTVQLNVVSPNYLQMVNLPVLRGRSLTEADQRGSALVLLVNQAYVKAFLADADPVGRQIQLPAESGSQWFTIVGIVPDRRNLGFTELFGPEAYLSSQQVAAEWVNYEFLIRAQTQSGALQQAIREAVRSVDYDQPVSNPQMVEAKLRRAVERDIGGVQAMIVIGSFGLVMAVLGIYGVVSNSIVERTHEIGIRVALGGKRTDMLALILTQGMRLAAFGLVIGMALAAATTFGIRQMLFGIRPVDPACYVSVCAILMGTAIAACYVPARRAARTDPMAALRYE
jgi:putative ABC transport system permease protein